MHLVLHPINKFLSWQITKLADSRGVQIGHIMFSGIVPWLADKGEAGTMLAPAIFAMLVLVGAIVVLGIYCATQARQLLSFCEHL